MALTVRAIEGIKNLTKEEAGSRFCNDGRLVEFVLPKCEAGLVYSFVVVNALGLKIKCREGNNINHLGRFTTLGGYVKSVNLGDSVKIRGVSSSQWDIIEMNGEFTLDS